MPRDYYKSIDQCVDPSRLTQVTVAAGSKLDLDVMVTEPNSVLRFDHFFFSYDFSLSQFRFVHQRKPIVQQA